MAGSVTIEQVRARLAELEKQKQAYLDAIKTLENGIDRARQNAIAVDGAIQDVQFWIQQLEPEKVPDISEVIPGAELVDEKKEGEQA